jgi:hypothetical protein
MILVTFFYPCRCSLIKHEGASGATSYLRRFRHAFLTTLLILEFGVKNGHREQNRLIANIFHGCSHPILRYLEIQDVAHLGGRDLGIQKAARFVMYNIRKGEKKTPQHSPVACTRVFYMCVGVHPRQPFFPSSNLWSTRKAPPCLLLPPLVLLGGFAKIHPMAWAARRNL